MDASGYFLPGGWIHTVAPGLAWLSDLWTFAALDQQVQVARGDHQNLGEHTGFGLLASRKPAVDDAVRQRGRTRVRWLSWHGPRPAAACWELCGNSLGVLLFADTMLALWARQRGCDGGQRGAPGCTPWPQRAQVPALSVPRCVTAGEYTTAALAWLESGGKADAQQLVKELVPARMADVRIDQRQGGAAITGAPELSAEGAEAPDGGPALAPGAGGVPTNGA